MPVRVAIAEAARLEGQTDRYISIAQFRPGHRRLAEDARFDAAELWATVLSFLQTTTVPVPTIVVASGRGLHLLGFTIAAYRVRLHRGGGSFSRPL